MKTIGMIAHTLQSIKSNVLNSCINILKNGLTIGLRQRLKLFDEFEVWRFCGRLSGSENESLRTSPCLSPVRYVVLSFDKFEKYISSIITYYL